MVWTTFIIAEVLSCIIATLFMKKIITISREFGSGGRLIGETLAKELGFAFYDKNIICDLAEKGNCVIVGRCADYILRNRPDVLNVFIHGNEPEKSQRIMKLYKKTRKEALALMKDTDKKRAVNYSYHTEQKWGSSKNYALCLNSSILGYETCIAIIRKSIKS